MNRWRGALLLAAGLIANGCARAARGTAAGAPETTTTASTSACAAANGVGKLRLLLALQPAVSEAAEALVRLESETERSSVRVNANLGTTFELRPGTYRLSITLAGYNKAERSASIDCGTDKTLTVPLARKR